MRPGTQLTTPELKFLLLLLKYPHYRAPISQLQPQANMPLSARRRLCRHLQQQNLVDCDTRINRFGLTAAGRTLLHLDTSVLPVTPDEKYVLQSCRDRSISPTQISARVPSHQRSSLIRSLAQQGLLRITQSAIEDVWLTPSGQNFLRHDCLPQGSLPVVSWSLMSDYLQFLRQPVTPPPVVSTALPTPD